MTVWVGRRLTPAVAYLLCTGLLYAPKYVIGATPPLRATVALAALLSGGALFLRRWRAVLAARATWERAALPILLGAIGVMFVATSLFAAHQYHHFVLWVDSPKFIQAFWLVLQGEGIRPLLGMDDPPQTHVTPTHLLVLPWFALVPSHLAFVVLRNLLLTSAALPLFLVARRRLSAPIALGLALAYLVNFPMLYTMSHGYHELHLFPFLFFLACWWFERRRYGAWLITLVLIAGLREEMGFVLLGFAAFAAVRRYPRRYAASAALLGLAWLVIAYGLLLGMTEGRYFFSYVFRDPKPVADTLFTVENARYAYQVGLPFLFVLPYLGWWCLPTLPVVLGNLYVSYPMAKVAFLPYGLPVVAGSFYAVAHHLPRLTARLPGSVRRSTPLWLVASMLALSMTQSIEHLFYEKSLEAPLKGELGIPLAAGTRVAEDPDAFRAWMAGLHRAVEVIPLGCRASVPAHLIAHVPYQRGYLDYGYERVWELPEYIVVDANAWYPQLAPPMQGLKRLLAQGHYVIETEGGGVTVHRLRSQPSMTPCLSGPLTDG